MPKVTGCLHQYCMASFVCPIRRQAMVGMQTLCSWCVWKLMQMIQVVVVASGYGDTHPITLLRWQAQHGFAYDLQCQQPELLLHIDGLP